MATYATNLTTFWLEGATTVTALGGGASGLGNPETDFFIQGSNCLSKQAWTNAIKGFIVDALGGNFTVPTTGGVIMWAKYDAAGSLDTKANGGLQMIIGSGSGDYYRYYIGGKTTLAFDSWIPYIVDPNTATADGTAAGTPTGSERWVGILANLPTASGPTKGNPIAVDAIRYGRCDLEYTDTGCTFATAEAWANDTTRRLGLLELLKGAYQMQGFHSFGTSGASVTFSDSNKVLFIRPTGANNLTNDAVATGFNRIEILNSGSSVTWDNIAISALGTRARGVFVHTAGTIAFTNCQFTDMDTFSLLAGSVITGTTWRRCNAITAPGSTLTSSQVLAPTVATNTSGLIWNVNTDTDGKLDGMTFSKGTNAHHAIELGTSSPLSLTLRNIDFTGFTNTVGDNAAPLHIKRTSGAETVNISASGCTGITANGYKSEGANVTITLDTRTVKISVVDVDGIPVTGARAFLRVSEAGALPYLASVTSITRASTLATVTHATDHGLATGDKVLLAGITDKVEDNAVFTITKTGATTYTYVTSDSGSTNYTGTITATFVFLKGLADQGTDSNEISVSRAITSAQATVGWARKGTGSPLYKPGPVAGDVSSTADTSFSAVMISDD